MVSNNMMFAAAGLVLSTLHSAVASPVLSARCNTTEASPALACPTVSGNILLTQFQLYPENLFYDSKNCKLILGALYNSSVYVFDTKTSTAEIINLDNITNTPALHLSGVKKSPVTGLLSIIVDAGAAFDTAGADISGDNFLIQYDLEAKKEVSRLNLTETTQGVYGGYQDVEFDVAGNIYVVGTYSSSILKVDPTGLDVEVWYLPTPIVHKTKGLGGLATVGDILLSNDNEFGQLLRFSTADSLGRPSVVATPNVTFNEEGDGIFLPPKYDGTVLLIAQNLRGVSVLRSSDKSWGSAEFLGLIPTPEGANTGVPTATTEIEGSVYMSLAYFFDTPIAGSSGGNRSEFPLFDITAALDALVV